MKKNYIALFLITIFLAIGGLTLTACSSETNDKLVIYTSFYPIYDFTRDIGGDKVEVVNLVKGGQEVHGYEPTTRQMAGMESADLIIISGQGMESWVDSLSNSLLEKIVDTSENVNIIERTTNENPIYDGVNDNGTSDPHIWLSINNAVIQMENIKNALIKIDPDNTSYYEERFETYSYLFNGLQSEYASTLAELTNRDIVVSHRAFGYLANDYNLVQYSLSGIESDTEPTPATLATIIDFINDNNVTAIFYQELANSEVAESIASQTSAKLYMLSTVATLTDEEIANGETYLTIMARNLTTLINALS